MPDTTKVPAPQAFDAARSLTDPYSSFRHLVESQRAAAISRESFLLAQQEALNAELESVQNVIRDANALLDPPTMPRPVVTPAAELTESEVPPPPPPLAADDASRIPPFLLKSKNGDDESNMSELEKALIGEGARR